MSEEISREEIAELLARESMSDAISIPQDALKWRGKNMVAYNVEWLREHWQQEMDIVCGVKPCEDAISRHYLRKQFQEKCVGECSCCKWDSPYWCVLIDSAPPVNPQPKTGHWKYAEQLQAEICSCCGCIKGNYFFSDIEVPIKFCPNCGASMESEGRGMTNSEREQLIKQDMKILENHIRHIFNQGYEAGFTEGKRTVLKIIGDNIDEIIRDKRNSKESEGKE